MLELNDIRETAFYKECFLEGKLEGKLEAKMAILTRLRAKGHSIKEVADLFDMNEEAVLKLIPLKG